MYQRSYTNNYFAIVAFALILFFSGLVSASEYQINYGIQNEWGSGFIAQVTLINNSDSAIDGWTVEWTFPDESQTIVNGWNGIFSQSGTEVTVTDSSYNGYIPSGGEVTFGFQGSYSDSNPIPTDITLNGQSTGDDDTGDDDTGDDDTGDDDTGDDDTGDGDTGDDDTGDDSDNSLIDTSTYTADPAPMVYDNRIYLYTGHDEISAETSYVMKDYLCYSSSDMETWTNHGAVLNVGNVFAWSSGDAMAAQCISRNGKFYYYLNFAHKYP